MDSTNFRQDHHPRHHHHHQQQQQQEEEQQEQSYAYLGYSSLLESERRLSYGVPQSPPHHRLLGRQPNNQGGYTGASVEVPSASSGVTSEASSFSYHSISSNAEDVGSPNFPSSFPGMIQNPNENNPWFSQLEPGRSYNNSFTSLLSANAANSANFLGQLGLTSCLSTAPPDSSCFLGLNLQASDFLGGGRQLSTYGDALAAEKDAGGLSWPSRSRALGLTKATSSAVNNNGAAGTKRPAGGGDFSDTSLKAPSLAVSNKKSASKTPFPPLKVRKEKLGDRIAALHQLVSPFGKTDTASVLTEAIGYIQFLQDQIHTLCMPNVKPLRNKPCGRTTQTVLGEDQQESKVDEEAAQDLRTRGLCLVPLSWTSFITADQMDAFMNNHHHYF